MGRHERVKGVLQTFDLRRAVKCVESEKYDDGQSEVRLSVNRWRKAS